MVNSDIHRFVDRQLSAWPLAGANFKALENVHVREVEVNGLVVKLQFNPARMISSAAKLSKEDIARRRCFLCVNNRPAEQEWLKYTPESGNEYHILVNPYPIFPEHLVVALSEHADQGIGGRYEDMLQMAKSYPDMTFFYNGPCCGASAPDHHHFQGVPRGLMPLEVSVGHSLSGNINNPLTEICVHQTSTLYLYDNFSSCIFVISSKSASSLPV